MLTYNETLNAAGPLPTAFAVTAGGSAVGVTAATVSGSTVTLTLAAPVTSAQAVTVAYTDPTAGNDLLAVQDVAGNDAASLAATGVTNTTPVPPDTTPPLFQSATVAGNTLVLTYGETLSAAGPLPTAFNVTAGGSAVAVTAATVSGSTVTLTLAAPVANGQPVTVAYTDPTAGNDLLAVQDVAGNDAATLATTAVTNTTPDTTPPLFQSATVDGSSLVLTYNETLSAAGPLPTAFTVTAGGSAVNVLAATVQGSAVTLTLAAPVTDSQAVTVAYTDPTVGNDLLAVQDVAGNDAVTLATTVVTNVTPTLPDTTPPSFQSATVDGSSLVLTYSETLSPLGPLPNAFTVAAGGTAVGVTAATVSGSTVTLTLAAPVANGQTVTVAYADPTAATTCSPCRTRPATTRPRWPPPPSPTPRFRSRIRPRRCSSPPPSPATPWS